MSFTNGFGYALTAASEATSPIEEVQSSKVKMTASVPLHPTPSVTSTPTTSVPGASV